MVPVGDLSARLVADEHAANLPSRNLRGARDAFGTRNTLASRQAHAGVIPATEEYQLYFNGEEHTEEHETTPGDLVKAVVFGGLDGTVTIFAIVAGCVGADISPVKAIIIGIGNLLADAFSMGFGEYISSKAERDYERAEQVREEWEIENCPEGEKGEMVQIYQTKYGISYDDAVQMIDLAFKYPKFFLSHMMVEELGLINDPDSGSTPLKRGIVMFCSFGVFGLIPLVGFTLWLLVTTSHLQTDSTKHVHVAFLVTCLITLATLFILGTFKARFANENPLAAGTLMMLNGAVASVVAYGSGSLLQSVALLVKESARYAPAPLVRSPVVNHGPPANSTTNDLEKVSKRGGLIKLPEMLLKAQPGPQVLVKTLTSADIPPQDCKVSLKRGPSGGDGALAGLSFSRKPDIALAKMLVQEMPKLEAYNISVCKTLWGPLFEGLGGLSQPLQLRPRKPDEQNPSVDITRLAASTQHLLIQTTAALLFYHNLLKFADLSLQEQTVFSCSQVRLYLSRVCETIGALYKVRWIVHQLVLHVSLKPNLTDTAHPNGDDDLLAQVWDTVHDRDVLSTKLLCVCSPSFDYHLSEEWLWQAALLCPGLGSALSSLAQLNSLSAIFTTVTIFQSDANAPHVRHVKHDAHSSMSLLNTLHASVNQTPSLSHFCSQSFYCGEIWDFVSDVNPSVALTRLNSLNKGLVDRLAHLKACESADLLRPFTTITSSALEDTSMSPLLVIWFLFRSFLSEQPSTNEDHIILYLRVFVRRTTSQKRMPAILYKEQALSWYTNSLLRIVAILHCRIDLDSFSQTASDMLVQLGTSIAGELNEPHDLPWINLCRMMRTLAENTKSPSSPLLGALIRGLHWLRSHRYLEPTIWSLEQIEELPNPSITQLTSRYLSGELTLMLTSVIRLRKMLLESSSITICLREIALPEDRYWLSFNYPGAGFLGAQRFLRPSRRRRSISDCLPSYKREASPFETKQIPMMRRRRNTWTNWDVSLEPRRKEIICLKGYLSSDCDKPSPYVTVTDRFIQISSEGYSFLRENAPNLLRLASVQFEPAWRHSEVVEVNIRLERFRQCSQFLLPASQAVMAMPLTRLLMRRRKAYNRDFAILPAAGGRQRVVIDGSNVAMSYMQAKTKNRKFSTVGIQLVLDYFMRRGVDVVAVLPSVMLDIDQVNGLQRARNMNLNFNIAKLPDDINLLRSLHAQGLVDLVPPQDYDDSYIIRWALMQDSCIVSNDQFRDKVKKETESPQGGKMSALRLQQWIRRHRISYAFIRGHFIPNPDFKFPATCKGSK